MFNRYIDENTETDFIYINIALKNIEFALISLDYIFNKSLEKNRFYDDHTYYFFTFKVF